MGVKKEGRGTGKMGVNSLGEGKEKKKKSWVSKQGDTGQTGGQCVAEGEKGKLGSQRQ